MARIIDCKAISQKIRDEIRKDIELCERAPRLVVIQVGDDPASTSYVTGKEKVCKEVGIDVTTIKLPEDISEVELLSIVRRGFKYIDDRAIKNYFVPSFVDGILVQLPLPKHINERKVIDAIPPEKDVDGFTPINIGKVMLGDKDAFIPCTPAGILEILKAEKIDTQGKNVVVVGRSNIVGRPIANLLSQKPWNATVTICNSFTELLMDYTLYADIIILAAGHPDTLKYHDVVLIQECDNGTSSNEQVIIDVGVNRIPDETKKSGFRLVGDMSDDIKEISDITYTQVPGGVGPMTISMLLKNTLQAYKQR